MCNIAFLQPQSFHCLFVVFCSSFNFGTVKGIYHYISPINIKKETDSASTRKQKWYMERHFPMSSYVYGKLFKIYNLFFILEFVLQECFLTGEVLSTPQGGSDLFPKQKEEKKTGHQLQVSFPGITWHCWRISLYVHIPK